MTQDATSLDRMRDIVVPPDVSWWPPAPGWWCVGLLLLTAIAAILIVFVRHRRATAYRRAATRALRQAESAVEIAGILKRTALAMCSRKTIARLSGDAWCDWLCLTGTLTMSAETRAELTTAVYGDDKSIPTPQLRLFAARWITSHQLPESAEHNDP